MVSNPEPGANGSQPIPVEEFACREDFPHCLQDQFIAIGKLTGEVVNVTRGGCRFIFRVSSRERRSVDVEVTAGRVRLAIGSPDKRMSEWEYLISTADME